MDYFLGTLLASPVVRGSSGDTYGTHHSVLGVGGYMELETITQRNALPVDSVAGLHHDGISSGQRRLGMLVKVIETNTFYELKIDYSVWTGLTSTAKVTALDDDANWIVANFAAGSGDKIEKVYNQTSHGFALGDVVEYSGGTFIKALAQSGRNSEVIGFVSNILTANDFSVVFAGYINNISILGLSPSTTYFLNSTLAGALTSTEPFLPNTISKPILTTLTNNDAIIFQYRAFTNTTGVTGGGGSGTTLVNVGSGTGQIFSGSSGGFSLIRTLTAGSGMTVTTSGDTIILNASGGTIGNSRDGSYADGLFPFTPSTPTGYAVDDINEFLGLLAPQQPPILIDQTTSGTFTNGKLSFGVTRNDIGYTNVGTAAGNSAVDINGLYTAAGTRRGLTQAAVTGILNDATVGNISGIPFLDNSFKDGNTGRLVLQVNGTTIDTLNLANTTGVTASTRMSVSAALPVKFANGNPFNSLLYRTGTFTLPTSVFLNGFNYVRVLHTGATIGTRVTNYTEWVYDPNVSAISIGSNSLANLNMTGSKYISGVQYHTGGAVDYLGTLSNVYRNVYSSDPSAVSFPTRVNLGAQTSISLAGSGIVAGFTTALPNLNTAVSNPEATTVAVSATMPINVTTVLGSLGTGTISSNIRVLHPFTIKSLTSTSSSLTGFLMYNINQTDDKESENFTGEVNRLEARDYTVLTYNFINTGTYAWDETENLRTGNAQHNTGLLVFNGELMYPNAAYLNSQYGITNGNFSVVANAHAGNPNYTTASGIRNYYRLFKSNNATTQSVLTFTITHTGTGTDFLTNGGTAGTPTANELKLEFVVKRVGGTTHGWANPFASIGNPEGIANTSITHISNITTVTCTLSTTPRVAINDIVVARLFVSAAYANRISNISITNI